MMRGPGEDSAALKRQREKDIAALCEIIASLANGEEASLFLRDLATPAEIEAFAERWRIVRLLDEGEKSYREIASETGASTTTVGRVARFLKNESHGGYRLMLDKRKTHGILP